jgi:ribosomal protein S18 acetylase RimI-like enzyme
MSAKIIVRDYNPEDWASVKLIILESDVYSEYGPTVLKSEKNRINFYNQVSEKGRAFVAVLPTKSTNGGNEKNDSESDVADKDSVVGYAILDFFGRGIFILSLIIGKEFRNQGYGKFLLEYIKEFAKKDPQYTILRGFADERFTNVHVFLIKNGFKACGFVEHDLSLNHSTIHYVLPLRKDETSEQDILISA